MTVLRDVQGVVRELWPEDTAESWDRVGLVTGDPERPVRRVLLAVDPVDATVREARDWSADLLVTHHPLLLRGVSTVAEDTAKGALIAQLIRANIALIAAHTNADQPTDGVSDVLAQRFGLRDARPIVPLAGGDGGIGRVGELAAPATLGDFARLVHRELPETAWGIRVAGDPEASVATVALCGGAGDSLLDHPAVRGADVYVTSDLRHHPASEAREQALVTGGPALIDVSHWAAESLWLDTAAAQLAERLPGVEVRVSQQRTDAWDLVLGGDRRVPADEARAARSSAHGRHGR